jgi:hypothetical protein
VFDASERFERFRRWTLLGARVGLSTAFGIVGAELIAWGMAPPLHAFVWSVSAATLLVVYWKVLGWLFRRLGWR